MKVQCICGKMGILQVRGKSARVQHYVGFVNGKRKYIWHKLPWDYYQKLMENMNVADLRSSGVGLRGFKSHPPHQ